MGLRSVFLSGSPNESRVSDFGIPRQVYFCAFINRNVIFDEESMLQDKSEPKDKAQGGASDSSANTQNKGVEFSESPKRLEGLEEDPSNSDGDNKEVT